MKLPEDRLTDKLDQVALANPRVGIPKKEKVYGITLGTKF
jgi:hypothetical protein